MRLELLDAHLPRVESIWRELEARAKPSYFLTWGWMENWLACLPRREMPQLAVLSRGGKTIAACFLGRRRLRRHGLITSRALFVNNTGLDAYDELCLEHNTMLADGGGALAALVEALPPNWDELYVPAADESVFAAIAKAPPPGTRVRIDREVANYHVDLDKVRASSGGYVALLGSSTRAQLRKAQRHAGDVTYEVATDAKQALEIYGEMVALHQRTWRERGQAGAFADPWFDRFHRRLIEQRFSLGELQLLRLRAKDLTLGCLYNFVGAGRVLFYQCGFGTPADKHVRPGYLCHAHAIEHSAKQGHAIYDLLGGDARYKRSLATDETRLVWGRVQRKRLVFSLEDRAREWIRKRRDQQASLAAKSEP
ncbi:MAG: GNAT family N-acetyltransferase [Kofleriaceae bacterium]|nr:GNAT family N-acetyltransferase [Kofleriaceae bacterium]